MPEEITAIHEDFSQGKESLLGNRRYYQGYLHGIETVMVYAKIGKVAAAMTAATLINRFNVDAIVFTGVAGAADMSLNIGDVVIADKLYQYDLDASPLFPKYEIPLMGKSLICASSTLNALLQESVSTFFNATLQNVVTAEAVQEYGLLKPKVVHGMIASGDQFISDDTYMQKLKDDTPGLCAIEMEGAAVAQVCDEFDVPFAVIRTISDKADDSAAINFQSFIKEVAGNYSQGIIAQAWWSLAKNGLDYYEHGQQAIVKRVYTHPA